MNTATRKSIPIQGDSFSVYCDTQSSVEVFSYISGRLLYLNVSYIQKNNGLKMAKISALNDGYYFVRSGKNIQSLKKGNVAYTIFMFDGKERTNLVLAPESYDEEGTKIGDNICEHIGFGIYAITPLVLTPSIVKVSGKIFFSFPNAENSDCPETNNAPSTVTINTEEQPTVIRIGGTTTGISIGGSGVDLSVGQTIFKV